MSGCGCGAEQAESLERKTLIILLAINGFMFVAELGIGWWAQSTGLIADSLDMLADAMVYGMSLYAVGKGVAKQAQAAKLSGYLQITLGLWAFFEVIRRMIFGSEPISTLMIIMGVIALIANVLCLFLIYKHKEGGVHMRASWIFSTNDVIANLGVIISGILVGVLGSNYPDLIVGALIAFVVTRGGIQIIKEAKQTGVAEKTGCNGQ